MPQNLDIKVLFCYSPQVLKDTYPNLDELKIDNKTLCTMTTGILQQNINKSVYKVKVLAVGNHQVDNLQKINGVMEDCLTEKQAIELTHGISQNLSYIVSMSGTLRQDLLDLQSKYKATVVVLQLKLCAQAGQIRPTGISGKIGIDNSFESFITIGRSTLVTKRTIDVLYWVLAHEFGHLMGCRHPYGTGYGTDNTASGNNHGNCMMNSKGKIKCGTLMSYAYPPIFYYSNPNLLRYPGKCKKDPCGIVGESEAYLTVNANIQKLAGIF